jgi:hypothetical protein
MANEATVRVGHCTPDAPNVTVLVDDSPTFEDLGFGDLTDYGTVPAGDHSIRVIPAAGGDAVIDTDLELAADTAYTVLATGMLEDIQPTVLTDMPGSVPSGKSHVRFVHASPDAPAVTVSVADGPALFTGIGFRDASEHVPVDAGTYDLDVRPADGDDIVLSIEDVSLGGGTAFTAIAMGLLEDDSLDVLLAEDAAAPVEADD